MEIKGKLTRLIKNKNPLFVGIGNVFKRDDAFGVYLGQMLMEAGINVLIVEMSIEKYIGKINRIPHDVLILMDSVSFNKDPGFMDLVRIDDIIDQTSHTHNLSLKRVAEFFEKPVYVLGVQPADISIGESLSEKVQIHANDLANMIIHSISDNS